MNKPPVMQLKFDRRYVAQGRYNYIGIDEHLLDADGKSHCLRTVITGIKPQKLGRQFAELLQMAYSQGRIDQKNETETD